MAIDRTQPETLPRLRALLAGARVWSAVGGVAEDEMAELRSSVLLDNHRRYLSAIPAYAALAAECLGDRAQAATLDDIRRHLIVTEDLFKSYDPEWLEGDLGSLTRWLRQISTTLVPALAGADDLDSWRAALKTHDVYVTFSSGTGGRPSLVPRDALTLAALRNSSGVRLPWAPRPRSYDCLLLTPPGLGIGIQSGAAGLAAHALGVHHLRPSRVRLHALARRNRPSAPAAPPADPEAAVAFLRAAAQARRPVVVYGPPSGLVDLTERFAGELPRLPAGSCVVTGGGWKGGADARDPWALFDAVSDRLGVPRNRCVDTFSAAELNTVFVSCERNRYHIPPVVEAAVLDDQFEPVTGAESTGRLAVLDPFALSYPGFVATGDLVRLRRDPCGCGLAGPTLLAPITRLPGQEARGCGVLEMATG